MLKKDKNILIRKRDHLPWMHARKNHREKLTEAFTEPLRVTFQFETSISGILGVKEEEIDFPRTVTLAEALKTISDKHGHLLGDHVHDEKGNVGPSFGVDVLVNGRSITTLQGLKTKLRDGDKVTFLPLVSGG